MDMITWSECETTISPPPMLDILSNEDIIKSKTETIHISKYPCHSQGVERAVKEVTIASKQVYGHDNRHGMVVNTVNSRQEMPSFAMKKDYLV